MEDGGKGESAVRFHIILKNDMEMETFLKDGALAPEAHALKTEASVSTSQNYT